MVSTFLYSMKIMFRTRSNLIWAVAFPLVLSTLFYSVFSSLDDTYRFDPVPVIIVQDENYQSTPQFGAVIDALSEPADGDKANGLTNQDFAVVIFRPTGVASESEALELLDDGEYFGYIMLDDHNLPRYFIDSRWLGNIGLDGVRQGIVVSVLDRYIQDNELITGLYMTRPEQLADPSWLESLFAGSSYVTRKSITANQPSDALRYYYAALAFSCMQMMSFGLTAVSAWKANTSALGARRALGGKSWLRSLTPNLLAAWCLSYICLVIGFVYIRYGFSVSFADKEAYCLLVLAVSTLLTTLLGALLGATPLPAGGKSGLVAASSCLLALLAGLYGPASQSLGDYVAREMPLLSDLNPARQVADALFSLYYYDGTGRMYELLTIMIAMAAVCFAACLLIMKKQRFNSL